MVERPPRARHRGRRLIPPGPVGMTAAHGHRPRRAPDDAPSRAALSRRLQVVRRDPGADRRVARAARRRGPRAGRRERRRQEHAGQDPRRRPPARQRHDPASTASRPSSPARRRRARSGIAVVHQEPRLFPDLQRRRERVHRPRARRAAADGRLGRDAAPGAGAVRRAGRQVRRPGAGPRPVDGRPAADRDRQGAVGRRAAC